MNLILQRYCGYIRSIFGRRRAVRSQLAEWLSSLEKLLLFIVLSTGNRIGFVPQFEEIAESRTNHNSGLGPNERRTAFLNSALAHGFVRPFC